MDSPHYYVALGEPFYSEDVIFTEGVLLNKYNTLDIPMLRIKTDFPSLTMVHSFSKPAEHKKYYRV